MLEKLIMRYRSELVFRDSSMRLADVFAGFDRQDCYLLVLGVICAAIILVFQYVRNQLQFNPLAAAVLLPLGFGLFIYARRKCDPIGFRFAFIGAMFLILAYLSWPNRPDWPTWYDQSHYLSMTAELSRGYLSYESFRYGIGYPILAVPFYYLIGKDALFIPSLLAFLGTIYLGYLFFRSLTSDLIAKISLLLLMFATTLAYHSVIWWGHAIVVFCLVAISYVSLKPLTNGRSILIGALMGYAFFTRYIDVVVFLPLLAYAFRKPRMKQLGLLVLGVVPFVAAAMIAQAAVFGSPFITPYRTQAGSVLSYFEGPAMTFYNFVLTFIYFPGDISVQMIGMEKMTVLIGMFYLIFAPLGAYLLYRNSERKGLVAAIIASAVITVLYSSSYYQFHSGTFGTFPTDFRYLLLAYPFMVLFATFGLSSFLKIDQKQKEGVVNHADEKAESQ
jgi:hypothetical protein